MKSRKITERGGYGDACGMAHALDLIGERWALLVVRELMLGPKRFGQLKADIPGISANLLTRRLEGLEAAGILFRRTLPPPTRVQVYELTPWGYEAEPIMQTLGRWAVRSNLHDPGLPISAVSILLSFRTMLDRSRARGIDARIGFAFGEEQYVGHLSEAGFEIARGDPSAADVRFVGPPNALGGAVYGGVPFAALEQAGALRVEGDRALAERFATLFPLPEKVAAAPPPA